MTGGKGCGFKTARTCLSLMVFLSCWVNYMMRINVSIVVLAFETLNTPSQHDSDCPAKNNVTYGDYGQRFYWNEHVRGAVLAAHGYGYLIMQYPGMLLTKKYGARWVIFAGALAMATGTAVMPACVPVHWTLVVLMRLVVGVGGGVTFPALNVLVVKWVLPGEQNMFSWAMMGGTVSTVVTWPLCALGVELIGWRALCYALAGMAGVWAALWVGLVYNDPESHPCLRLTDEQQRRVTVARPVLPPFPLRQVFNSGPLIALVILHFGNAWVLSLVLILLPRVLYEVLGYSLITAAALASAAMLARFLSGFLFSAAVTCVADMNALRLSELRKLFVAFSHILPGLLLLGMIFLACDALWMCIFFCVTLALNGAATVTNLANHRDLSPNYAGDIYMIMNVVGLTTAVIVPHTVAEILFRAAGTLQWKIIWGVSGSVYIITGLIFICLGSAEVQSWNDNPDDWLWPGEDESKDGDEESPPDEEAS